MAWSSGSSGRWKSCAGSRQLHVSGSRERALLAILLIHAGEVVAADRLIEELWGGDVPGNPANALQVVVSRVRKALEVPDGPGPLVTRRPGYLLDVRQEEVDARQVRPAGRGSQAGRARRQAARASLLEEALGLWRGPALTEFAAEGFARNEISRLEEERLRAIEMKAEAELALGRDAGARRGAERARGRQSAAGAAARPADAGPVPVGPPGRRTARLPGRPRRPSGGAWRRSRS